MLVNTEDLKPGDFITGSDMQDIMIPPPGITVEATWYDKSNGNQIVKFKDASGLEAFNPYWGWYIEREENKNGEKE